MIRFDERGDTGGIDISVGRAGGVRAAGCRAVGCRAVSGRATRGLIFVTISVVMSIAGCRPTGGTVGRSSSDASGGASADVSKREAAGGPAAAPAVPSGADIRVAQAWEAWRRGDLRPLTRRGMAAAARRVLASAPDRPRSILIAAAASWLGDTESSRRRARRAAEGDDELERFESNLRRGIDGADAARRADVASLTADLLRRIGRHDRAVAWATVAADAEPDSIDRIAALAALQNDWGDRSGANASWRRVQLHRAVEREVLRGLMLPELPFRDFDRAPSPDDFWGLARGGRLNAARAALSRGDIPLALSILDAAPPRERATIAHRVLRGRVLLQRQDADEMRRWFVDDAPDLSDAAGWSAEAWLVVGGWLTLEERDAAAESALRFAVAGEPACDESHRRWSAAIGRLAAGDGSAAAPQGPAEGVEEQLDEPGLSSGPPGPPPAAVGSPKVGSLATGLPTTEALERRMRMLGQSRFTLRTIYRQGPTLAAEVVPPMAEALVQIGRPLEGGDWLTYLRRTLRGDPADRSRADARRRQWADEVAATPDRWMRRRLLGLELPPVGSVVDEIRSLVASGYDDPPPSAVEAEVIDRSPMPPPGSDPVNETPGDEDSDGGTGSPATGDSGDDPLPPLHVAESAGRLGIDFVYRNKSGDPETDIAIHQSLGGGVAVCDYDHDGSPDLYFAQGGDGDRRQAAEGDPGIDPTDRLFRGVATLPDEWDSSDASVADPPPGRDPSPCRRFIDVTSAAGTVEFRYSIGVHVGDWNQDGWDDLVVSNLGRNRLWINRGDGTFAPDPIERHADWGEVLTSQCVIADLNVDGLPDLYVCNYVDDDRIFDGPRPGPDGRPQLPAPSNYEPTPDRWWIRGPDGTAEWTDAIPNASPLGPGLGPTIGDLDGDGKLEAFIANDSFPNHYWQFDDGDPTDWRETAALVGLAVGADGRPQACMGVSVGQYGGDERPDLHVTNFVNQPSNVYVQIDAGFRDRAAATGMALPSRPFTGFVAIHWDANPPAAGDDRFADRPLFVGNGHVFDERPRGGGFRMANQLFSVRKGRFSIREVLDDSEIFQRPALTRSAAVADLDGDGRQDLITTDLVEPVRVYCPTDGGPSEPAVLSIEATSRILSAPSVGAMPRPLRAEPCRTNDIRFPRTRLRLVGRQASREAIGAVVRFSDPSRSKWHPILGGGGYLGDSPRDVPVPVWMEDPAAKISVHWPTGRTQTRRLADLWRTETGWLWIE